MKTYKNAINQSRKQASASHINGLVHYAPGPVDIGPGGFCKCGHASGAKSKPDGTISDCLALLLYPSRRVLVPGGRDFIYAKDDGLIYVTYDFFVPGYGMEQPIASKEILLGSLSDWPDNTQNFSPNVELLQLLNSAANTFPWDESPTANNERATYAFGFGHISFVNSVVVVVELGQDQSGSYPNSVKRIVQPGDPAYEYGMAFESPSYVGTGNTWEHVLGRPRSSP